MKKILFLILFLTGLFPVFDSNGLYLGNYRSYGQGELNEIEIVNCTGVSSSVAYETDQYIEYEDCTEEYNYDYQLCEPTLDCTYRTEYKDGSDPCDPDTYDEALCNESNCSTVCPSDMVLNTACECVSPPCTITCPEGQRVTPYCGCEEIPPPSNCRVACLPGYTEINCVCVKNTTPPPPKPDPCAETIRQAFYSLIQQGKLAEILSKFNGSNAQYKISISIGSLGSDGDLARTSNSGTYRRYNIVFNENYPNATSLSKATSLIHEYIHAYFNIDFTSLKTKFFLPTKG